jgi:hypothetical protein
MPESYYNMLFTIAQIGIIGWVLLVFFPRWRGTRWIIDEGIFPLYLSILYTAALVPLAVELGPALIKMDFGNVEQVRALMADPEFAVVFWLHILAFDQVVGMLIYDDNMRHRYIPLWAQSIILAAVLFVGPLAMILYLILRLPKRQARKRELGAAAAMPGAPVQARPTATV